ncbi:hypothetical protein ebA995 [Aromatoleum aromaticum EbN1]|uniref:Uncharacterized protein n=1 Tax=Aromatoleum aromaticum (strain DSM 19018 / LMG 30748 / EbN1) TaxID=76114 RepID=Q5P7R2_AROAE|nr:hypothetical protein ebA995 [Aromatoleum aromaticum EbN1]
MNHCEQTHLHFGRRSGSGVLRCAGALGSRCNDDGLVGRRRSRLRAPGHAAPGRARRGARVVAATVRQRHAAAGAHVPPRGVPEHAADDPQRDRTRHGRRRGPAAAADDRDQRLYARSARLAPRHAPRVPGAGKPARAGSRHIARHALNGL